MPYFGDSMVANEIDYRQDTPLQSDIDTGCLAQCILFGMFGIDVAFDGTITINPVKTALSNKMGLRGLKLRGKNIDVSLDGNNFYVMANDEKYSSIIGNPVVIKK